MSEEYLEDSVSTQADADDDDTSVRLERVDESPTHEIITEELLETTAEDFSRYLTTNHQIEKQQLDERIESIVFRVEEFQRQLDWMHQNVTSTSEKVSDIHLQAQGFKELFNKIDQIEAFIAMVTGQIDMLEDTITRAEKELAPNKIRNVFSMLPGVRKQQRRDSSEPWNRPNIFNTREYFTIRTIEQSDN